MNYQVKTVNYRDPAMKSAMRKILRKEGLNKALWDCLAVVGQVAAILLAIATLLFAGLFAIGNAFAAMEGGAIIGAVLWTAAVLAVLICFVIRRRANPIRENLWPTEADVVTLTFGEDGFQVEEPRTISKLEYLAIRRVYETPTCFYLFLMKEHFLVVRKHDFTQGDSADFFAFLEGKHGQKFETR